MDKNIVKKLIADMDQATAWINFTNACANRDLQQYGAWRVDYESQAAMFRKDFEDAAKQLEHVQSCQAI